MNIYVERIGGSSQERHIIRYTLSCHLMRLSRKVTHTVYKHPFWIVN